MPAAKRDRDVDEGQTEWSKYVDAVVAQNEKSGHEKFPLDREWEPEEYLPDGKNGVKSLSAKALAYIQKNRESHDPANQNLYRRRLSLTDCFHARPVRANETDVFARKKRSAAGSGLDENDDALPPPLGAHEGPDFSKFVNKNHILAMEKKLALIGLQEASGDPKAAERLRREFGQQRGIIGTAIAPKIPRPLMASGLVRKRCDFVPIIIVPNAISAILQVWNIKTFLEQGSFEEASTHFLNNEDGTARLGDKELSVPVTPGSVFPSIDNYSVKFRQFRVVDRADAVDNWDHVCACIVIGKKWQLEDWYNGDKKKSDPATLFSLIRGFCPFFEEDKPPQQTKEWNVTTLQFSKKASKAYTHIQAAKTFWEEVFTFMDCHPNFRQYTLPADTALLGGVGGSNSQLGRRGGGSNAHENSSTYHQAGSSLGEL